MTWQSNSKPPPAGCVLVADTCWSYKEPCYTCHRIALFQLAGSHPSAAAWSCALNWHPRAYSLSCVYPSDDTIWGIEGVLAMLNELQLSHTEVRGHAACWAHVAWRVPGEHTGAPQYSA